MLKINKNTTIYILCEGNLASGGPEALHQLHYYLAKHHILSYLCYFGEANTHPRYLVYNPKVLPIEHVADHRDHILIVAEAFTKYLKKYSRIRKCIWWLGLQLYDGFNVLPQTKGLKLKLRIREMLPDRILLMRQSLLKLLDKKRYELQPYLIRNEDFHLCGSKFAFEFVRKRYKQVVLFVEPISLAFLRQTPPDLVSDGRGSRVLYNPSKPSALMTKLLQRTDIDFQPITGLAQTEMIQLFRRSKLYIDFGFFGGPERLPKETVFNGTLLLVGKRNAAVNDFDVAVPDRFKVVDMQNIDQVAEIIKHMLDNYDLLIEEFEPFRQQIAKLEENFEKSISKIFIKD